MARPVLCMSRCYRPRTAKASSWPELMATKGLEAAIRNSAIAGATSVVTMSVKLKERRKRKYDLNHKGEYHMTMLLPASDPFNAEEPATTARQELQLSSQDITFITGRQRRSHYEDNITAEKGRQPNKRRKKVHFTRLCDASTNSVPLDTNACFSSRAVGSIVMEHHA